MCLEVIFWCGGVLDTCLVAARASSSSSSSCDMQVVVCPPNVFSCMSLLIHGFVALGLMMPWKIWLVVLSPDLLVGPAHAFDDFKAIGFGTSISSTEYGVRLAEELFSDACAALVETAVAADVGRRSLLCVDGSVIGGARDEPGMPLVFVISGFLQERQSIHGAPRRSSTFTVSCCIYLDVTHVGHVHASHDVASNFPR